MKNEDGLVPISIVALVLKVTVQAVHAACARGDILYVTHAGRKYCSWSSVREYRWYHATKFKDNGTRRNDMKKRKLRPHRFA